MTVFSFRSFVIGHCFAVWPMPPSSESSHTPLDTEDEGTTFLPNTTIHSPSTVVSHYQCLSFHWMQTQRTYSTAQYILFSQHFVRHSTCKKVFQIKEMYLNNIRFILCIVSRWVTFQDTTDTWPVKVTVKCNFFLSIARNQKNNSLKTKTWQDCEITLTGSGSAYGDCFQHQDCSGPAYEHL